MDKLDALIDIEKCAKDTNRLIWGVVIYCISYLIGTLEIQPDWLLFIRLFQGIGLLLFAMALIGSARFSTISDRYFKIVFILLMGWHCFVILSNFTVSSTFIKTYLREPYYFLHFFVPLVILLPANFFADYFSRWSFRLVILFFILFIPFSYWIFGYQTFSEQYVWVLGVGGRFIILNYIYFSAKIRILSFIVVILSLFICTYMARRNIMLTFSGYLFATGCLYFAFTSLSDIIKKIMLCLLLIIMLIGGYLFFLSVQDTVFSDISDRALVNSREDIFLSYFEDMSERDWIIGKGMDGTYYAPTVDEESPFGTDEDYRFLIEGGYLQVILKGGVINVLLFLLIALPAIKKGLFHSNNLFTKSSAMLIILWLVDMFPWGMPAFDLRYMLFWFSIGVCYNSELRSFSDAEIKEYCFPWFN